MATCFSRGLRLWLGAGLSPLPVTLFLTQDLDPNIQSDLVRARTPQVRVVFHASPSVAMGVSFESGDTYAGGSAGAGTITAHTCPAPLFARLACSPSAFGSSGQSGRCCADAIGSADVVDEWLTGISGSRSEVMPGGLGIVVPGERMGSRNRLAAMAEHRVVKRDCREISR